MPTSAKEYSIGNHGLDASWYLEGRGYGQQAVPVETTALVISGVYNNTPNTKDEKPTKPLRRGVVHYTKDPGVRVIRNYKTYRSSASPESVKAKKDNKKVVEFFRMIQEIREELKSSGNYSAFKAAFEAVSTLMVFWDVKDMDIEPFVLDDGGINIEIRNEEKEYIGDIDVFTSRDAAYLLEINGEEVSGNIRIDTRRDIEGLVSKLARSS